MAGVNDTESTEISQDQVSNENFVLTIDTALHHSEAPHGITGTRTKNPLRNES